MSDADAIAGRVVLIGERARDAAEVDAARGQPAEGVIGEARAARGGPAVEARAKRERRCGLLKLMHCHRNAESDGA
jgi:hypothetical protein